MAMGGHKRAVTRAAQIVAEQFAHLDPAQRVEKLQDLTTQFELEEASVPKKGRPKTQKQIEAASRTAKQHFTPETRRLGVDAATELRRQYGNVESLSDLMKRRLQEGAKAEEIVDTYFEIAVDKGHPLCLQAGNVILERTEGKVAQPVTLDATITVAAVKVIGATEEELAAIKQFEGPALTVPTEGAT